jgi:hypothetical protein
VWQETTQEDAARSDMFTLQDEFTDNSLGLSSQDSGKVYKLPKGAYATLRDGRDFHPVLWIRIRIQHFKSIQIRIWIWIQGFDNQN